MNLCETCKHWEPEGTVGHLADIGACRKISSGSDAFDYEWRIYPEYKDAKAFALDGDMRCAELVTLKTFGCVMHEEKTT